MARDLGPVAQPEGWWLRVFARIRQTRQAIGQHVKRLTCNVAVFDVFDRFLLPPCREEEEGKSTRSYRYVCGGGMAKTRQTRHPKSVCAGQRRFSCLTCFRPNTANSRGRGWKLKKPSLPRPGAGFDPSCASVSTAHGRYWRSRCGAPLSNESTALGLADRGVRNALWRVSERLFEQLEPVTHATLTRYAGCEMMGMSKTEQPSRRDAYGPWRAGGNRDCA